MKGKVAGKRTKDRPRKSIIDSMYDKLNLNEYVELLTMAMDQTLQRQSIAFILNKEEIK